MSSASSNLDLHNAMKHLNKIILTISFITVALLNPHTSYALCGYWNSFDDTCPITGGLQCQAGSAQGEAACCNPQPDCGDASINISTGVTGGITVPSSKLWVNSPSAFLSGLTSEILLYAIAFVGLFFLVRLIVAGFTMVTAIGDSAKIEGAKQTLTHAFIGLTITLSVFFIAQILKRVLGLNIPGL